VHEKFHKEKLDKAAEIAIKVAKVGGVTLSAGTAIATTVMILG
jgi:hypothetical protein